MPRSILDDDEFEFIILTDKIISKMKKYGPPLIASVLVAIIMMGVIGG